MAKFIDKNVIYEIFTPECAPCRSIEHRITALTEKYKDAVSIKKVNANDEENNVLIEYLGVNSVPTAVVIKEGVEVARFQGTSIPNKLDEIIPKTFF